MDEMSQLVNVLSLLMNEEENCRGKEISVNVKKILDNLVVEYSKETNKYQEFRETVKKKKDTIELLKELKTQHVAPLKRVFFLCFLFATSFNT